jgi:hypothetical protein
LWLLWATPVLIRFLNHPRFFYWQWFADSSPPSTRNAIAFADDPAAGFPSPEVAWEHLNGAIYGDGEVERPAALPNFLPNQFKDDYRRHLRTLVEKPSAVRA